jgi:hypothetical protein
MNPSVGRPEIGQWYAIAGKGDLFRAIEIQNLDGDIDEIDAETWSTLPLERTEQPEDWTAPTGDAETEDSNYTQTEVSPGD